jgi:hypothetical protein
MASLRKDDRGNYVRAKSCPRTSRRIRKAVWPAPRSQILPAREHREARGRAPIQRMVPEVEGNIIAIRAARNGTGQSLTQAQARRLAGDWYEWFIANHTHISLEEIERHRDDVVDAFTDADTGPVVTQEEYDRFSLDELWRISLRCARPSVPSRTRGRTRRPRMVA